MPTKIENAQEMSVVRIVEMYPDDYILVQIVTRDITGIPLYTSKERLDLVRLVQNLNIATDTIIMEGENFDVRLGGLL